MVKIRDLLELAFESLAAYWQRTLLTMLGVAVGIAAVVTVMVLGETGKELVAREIRNVGENLFVVAIKGESGVELAQEGELSIQDAEVAGRAVTSLEAIVPHSDQLSFVKTPKGRRRVSVLGTTEQLVDLRETVEIERGRFLSAQDVRRGRRVAVISARLEDDLKLRRRSVGQRIFLGNMAVTVVGVTKRRARSLLGGGGPPPVYVPITLFHGLFQTRRVGWLEGKAVHHDQVDRTMAETVRLVGRLHKGTTEYAGESLEDTIRTLAEAIGIVSRMVAAIAGVSLLVAAIGVMNLMLVSVSERTSEIGLRKAVGARSLQILKQFLAEAVILCSAGGALGGVLGLVLAIAITSMMGVPFAFPLSALALAFLVSISVGLISGTYPALRAADLDPIEALRQE